MRLCNLSLILVFISLLCCFLLLVDCCDAPQILRWLNYFRNEFNAWYYLALVGASENIYAHFKRVSIFTYLTLSGEGTGHATVLIILEHTDYLLQGHEDNPESDDIK